MDYALPALPPSHFLILTQLVRHYHGSKNTITISHDLPNVLTNISVLNELLSDSINFEEKFEAVEYINLIARQ